MTSIDNVAHGVAAYLDHEIVPKLPGWKRWIFSAASSAYLEEAEHILNEYRDRDWIRMLNVIDDHNMIDVEKIYKHFRNAASKGDATIELPLIGTITLSLGDVEEMYSFIVH